MNQLVISGTQGNGISGTSFSSFQEPERCSSYGTESLIRAANLSNPESFGFFLTAGLLHESSCEGGPSTCDGRRAFKIVEISPNPRVTVSRPTTSVAVAHTWHARWRAT